MASKIEFEVYKLLKSLLEKPVEQVIVPNPYELRNVTLRFFGVI